jgi:TPR repeat protein
MPLLFTLLFVACSTNVEESAPGPEPEPAIMRFEKGCEDGDAAACASLGLYYAEDSAEPDAVKSLTYMKRACDLDHGSACGSAGARLMRQTPPDSRGAQSLFSRGCEMDDPGSCFNLGRSLADGDDPEAMEAAYAKACDADEKHACTNLAAHLHDGPRSDPRRGHEAAARAAALTVGLGCALMATYYRSGDPRPIDIEKAESLERQACSLGHRAACPGALGKAPPLGQGSFP